MKGHSELVRTMQIAEPEAGISYAYASAYMS